MAFCCKYVDRSTFLYELLIQDIQTSPAYSSVGLMKVNYIFERVCLERVN